MTTEADPDASADAKRGRPRVPGVGERVRAAAIDELIKNGLETFSISRVARRAGVAKGTVSLRWPEPLDLVLDALSTRLVWEPVSETGDLGSELMALSRRLEPAFGPPLFGLIHSALGAAAGRPAQWERWVERIVGPGLRLSREVFERAAARGDISPDVDISMLVMTFIGGLQLTTQANPKQLPPSRQQRKAIIAIVLRACQA